MSKKLLVHLGPAKTATTSLQSFLSSENLQPFGIGLVSPFLNRGSHHDLARTLGVQVPIGLRSSKNDNLDQDSAIQMIQDFLAESSSQLNVISSEFLAELPPEKVLGFFDRISSETTFVLSVRNPLAHAVSFWAETTRAGRTDRLQSFLEEPYRFISWWRDVYLTSEAIYGSKLQVVCVSESTPVLNLISSLFGSEVQDLYADLEIRKNVSNCPAAVDVLAMLNESLLQTPSREGWISHYLHESLREASAGEGRLIPSTWIAAFRTQWESSNVVNVGSCFSACLTGLWADAGNLLPSSEGDFVLARQRIVENLAISEVRKNALAHLEIDRLLYAMKNDQLGVSPISIVGDSHSIALGLGCDLLDPVERNLFFLPERDKDSGIYWQSLERICQKSEMVCISWRGNEHNVLGIAPQERFRVFKSPNSSDESASSRDPMIPISQIRAAFKRELEPLLELLGKLPSHKTLVVIGPPPPKSRDVVRRHLESDGFFSQMVEAQDFDGNEELFLTDDTRMMLWEIQCEEYRALSDKVGAHFAPAPPISRSKSGFLKAMYANKDCTHANDKYGLIVLQELIRIFRTTGGKR